METSVQTLKSKIKDIQTKEKKVQSVIDNKPVVKGKEGLLDTIDWLEKILISFRDFKKL